MGALDLAAVGSLLTRWLSRWWPTWVSSAANGLLWGETVTAGAART